MNGGDDSVRARYDRVGNEEAANSLPDQFTMRQRLGRVVGGRRLPEFGDGKGSAIGPPVVGDARWLGGGHSFNLWVVTSQGTIDGDKTVVFAPDGTRLATLDVSG